MPSAPSTRQRLLIIISFFFIDFDNPTIGEFKKNTLCNCTSVVLLVIICFFLGCLEVNHRITPATQGGAARSFRHLLTKNPARSLNCPGW